VVPVRVQGDGAAQEIAAAIDLVNRRADIDLIITGRGGGSREDLWAFNEESVARAIARSRIPVISAVGHEPDVTIADYVADMRAATPSNAAELAVPDQVQVGHRLSQLSRRLAGAQRARLMAGRKDLRRLADSRVLRNPKAPIEDGRILVDRAQERLTAALKNILKDGRGELARLGAGLDAMSPLKVLGRGYAMARGPQGVITRAAQAEPGQALDVLLADGTLRCEVKEKEETEPWQVKS
ncbi:MAG TPA: exodeoxyribonuclease VII large subunit, partial [Candidatus Enterenecus stercoripullorum]|nr:exodeoxyribonuclease VII large subunit [Candidatus Enterenecus stercoripullorum]